MMSNDNIKKLDRIVSGCVFCDGVPYSEPYEIKKITDDRIIRIKADLVQAEPNRIVLYTPSRPYGFWDVNYCPICGRKL